MFGGDAFSRYDIFMLCWDDGAGTVNRTSSNKPKQLTSMDYLAEIFREEMRYFGNIRWIFWARQHIMDEVWIWLA